MIMSRKLIWGDWTHGIEWSRGACSGLGTVTKQKFMNKWEITRITLRPWKIKLIFILRSCRGVNRAAAMSDYYRRIPALQFTQKKPNAVSLKTNDKQLRNSQRCFRESHYCVVVTPTGSYPRTNDSVLLIFTCWKSYMCGQINVLLA